MVFRSVAPSCPASSQPNGHRRRCRPQETVEPSRNLDFPPSGRLGACPGDTSLTTLLALEPWKGDAGAQGNAMGTSPRRFLERCKCET